jgi:hypothetical protein
MMLIREASATISKDWALVESSTFREDGKSRLNSRDLNGKDSHRVRETWIRERWCDALASPPVGIDPIR